MIDRFVDDPLDSTRQESPVDVDALVGAIELVLAERGLSADRRRGAVARQLALAWLVENALVPESALMECFQIDRIGTLRTAISRARALVTTEPDLCDAQRRAAGLLAGAAVTSRV